MAPFFILVGTVGLNLVIPNLLVDTTFLTVYFVITCTSYNLFLMFVISTGQVVDGEDVAHYFSILVPAYNEEKVIGKTLKRILSLDYPPELFEVIVVNDGSTDRTERVVRNFQKRYSNLKLVNISPERGGNGKSSALNTGFADFLLCWRGLEVRPRQRWIIGVFDADALPEANMLKQASFQFNDLSVGGVQTLVRIKNRKASFLAKLQDIEFLAFARVVQYARTIFTGAVALGGNGQFVRATALDTVAIREQQEYWKKDSLTEDLDMGVRLIAKRWKNRYIDSTAVHQEGTETWLTMFRQRERWAWGTLQALVSFVLNPRFWALKIGLKKKIDISIYLFHILVPFLVILCWIWSGMSLVGLIDTYNSFPLAFCVANGVSFFPFIGYGLWKERKEYPLWQLVPLLFITTAYTYHWIPCITSALLKLATHKPIWSKTPRFDKQEPTILKRERDAVIIRPKEDEEAIIIEEGYHVKEA
ncbi:MAG: glycosyltransferase family 2 protein [Candidatus Bathyarchaeota archaeon]|nr:MAG: glycosyltransferase family 2 protein [Candidatus Bathyarchaeota archaeon]